MATQAFLLKLNFDLPPKFNLLVALRNVLFHHFEQNVKDINQVVKAILPRSSRQFIVFIGVDLVASFDVTSRTFTIAGPIVGDFISLDSNLNSEIIAIKTSSKDPPNIVKSLCTEYNLKCSAVFTRNNEILLVMNNNSQTLSKFTNKLSQFIYTERVALAHHRCVDFYWHCDRNITFTDSSAKLHAAGLNFTTLIRSVLSLREQQPCIVSVQEIPPCTPSNSTFASNSLSIQPDLILVCCNETDESIVRRIGRIYIANGVYITSDPYDMTMSEIEMDTDYKSIYPALSSSYSSEQTCLSENLYKSLQSLASSPSPECYQLRQTQTTWPLQQKITSSGNSSSDNKNCPLGFYSGIGLSSTDMIQLGPRSRDSPGRVCAYVLWYVSLLSFFRFIIIILHYLFDNI